MRVRAQQWVDLFLRSTQVAVGKGDRAKWHGSSRAMDSEECEEEEHLQGGIKAERETGRFLCRGSEQRGGLKQKEDQSRRRISAAPLTLLKMSCFAFSSALPLPAGSNITLGTKVLANSGSFTARPADVLVPYCRQKKMKVRLCLRLSVISNVDLWDLKVEGLLNIQLRHSI